MQALLQASAAPAGAVERSHKPGCPAGRSRHQRKASFGQGAASQRLIRAAKLQEPQGRQASTCPNNDLRLSEADDLMQVGAVRTI